MVILKYMWFRVKKVLWVLLKAVAAVLNLKVWLLSCLGMVTAVVVLTIVAAVLHINDDWVSTAGVVVFIGIFVVVVLVVALIDDDTAEAIAEATSRTCPACGKRRKQGYTVCHHCGFDQAEMHLAEPSSAAQVVGDQGAARHGGFTVIIDAVGDRESIVIKRVRGIKALFEDQTIGKEDAKDLIDAAPAAVLEGVDKATAQKARKVLEKAGAVVTVRRIKPAIEEPETMAIPEVTEPVAEADSVALRLQRLADLHAGGVISDEELGRRRQEILREL